MSACCPPTCRCVARWAGDSFRPLRWWTATGSAAPLSGRSSSDISTNAAPAWTTARCRAWPAAWSATSGPTSNTTTPSWTPCTCPRTWPWKQRAGFVIKPGRPPVARQNRLGVLVSVRAFYLDIAHWALEDATWPRWAVPSPVRQADLAGFAKNKKTVQARMHQRVRERLPRLPDLLDAVDRYRTEQTRLLTAAEATPVGQEFEHQGRHLRRIGRDQDRTAQRLQYRPSMVLIEDTASGEQHDLTR